MKRIFALTIVVVMLIIMGVVIFIQDKKTKDGNIYAVEIINYQLTKEEIELHAGTITTRVNLYFNHECGETKYETIAKSNDDFLQVVFNGNMEIEITRKGIVYSNGKKVGKLKYKNGDLIITNIKEEK